MSYIIDAAIRYLEDHDRHPSLRLETQSGYVWADILAYRSGHGAPLPLWSGIGSTREGAIADLAEDIATRNIIS